MSPRELLDDKGCAQIKFFTRKGRRQVLAQCAYENVLPVLLNQVRTRLRGR